MNHRFLSLLEALLPALLAAPVAQAQAFGQPFYSIELEPTNSAGNFPPDERVFIDSSSAIGGQIGVGRVLGRYVLPPKQADLSGAVLNDGVSFWAPASAATP